MQLRALPEAWQRARQPAPIQTHTDRLPTRDLADNRIEGSLPDEWARGMDSLRAANLSNNSISGALPDKWANLTSLQAL